MLSGRNGFEISGFEVDIPRALCYDKNGKRLKTHEQQQF